MKTLFRPAAKPASATRFFTVLVLATLLFSVLPALSPSVAAVQDGDIPTPTSEIEESEDPNPESQEGEASSPTEEAQQSDTESQTPEAQSGGVSSFFAEARACPPGFDPSTGDASLALANCVAPLPGVAFTLGTQNPNYPGDTRTTGGDGIAVWPDIPRGTGYSVAQSIPQGHADPWVYCEVTGGPGADQYLFYQATGGYLDIGLNDPNLANYAQAYCRWFDVQSGDPALALTPDANAAAGVAEVYLTNYLCPVNYDTADMTLGALEAACTTAGQDISFTLAAGVGSPKTATTDAQGAVSWTNIPSGKLTIAESLPAGIRFAQPYCSVAPVGSGPGNPDLSLVQSDGKTISGQVAPGQALHCKLFNIPVPQSTVAVIPFLCPSDYDTADMTLQALTVGCSIPGLNIEFTLTTVEGEQLTGTTGTNGFLEWKNLTSGTVKIEQQTPEGYLAGPTYCDPAPPAGELDGSYWQFPTYEGDAFSFDIPERYTLNCVSFYAEGTPPTVVAAGTGTGSVTVQGYVCADELYDPAKSLQNYLDLCPTPHDGASVRLFSAESGADLTAQFAGSAQISFPDVPPGETELNLLGGSNESRLFCANYPRGAAAPPISAYTESSAIAGIEADFETSCYWFNFQELPDDAYVTITIEKYLCGPEYPDTVKIEDWRAACTDPHADVTFTAEHIGGPIATETTGADGTLTFELLPGDVYIQATPPISDAKGYAWCGADATGTSPEYVNAGRLNAGEPSMPLSDIDPALVYSCEWYTVPLEVTSDIADEGGVVTIVKWRCPEGYDTDDPSPEHLREVCSTPQPGIQIGVSYESGESFTQLTRLEKGPAIARFEGLPPGKVGIGELGPSGHELRRVICTSGDVGQTMFGVLTGYTEYQVADGGIAATIEAGKYLACEFFNVPLDDYEGDPPTAGMAFMSSRSCPPGFNAIAASYVDIAMYCSPEPGVEFTLTQGETTSNAVTDSEGSAKFKNLAVGPVRIAEFPREDYDPPRVFCRASNVTEGGIGELLPVTVDNWGIAYDLPEDAYLECVWANMPKASTSADPGTILLHAYTCPEGTGDYTPLGELLAACTVRPEGLKFTVEQPLATPVEALTDAAGNVTFTNVAPGFEVIDQPAGQGYDTIAAWCDYYASGSAGDLARYSAPRLSAYMPGGYTLECSWFQMPYIEPATLDITVRVCKEGLPPVDVTNDKILADCLTIPFGTAFRVQQGSTLGAESAPGTYDATLTTNLDGQVFVDELPPMPLRISEADPSSRTIHVNCGSAPIGQSPSSYTALTVTADGIDYPAEPGTAISCFWALELLPPIDISISVSSCPADLDFAAATVEQLALNCTPEPDIDMRIAIEGGIYDKTVATDRDGLAGFIQVPPGVLSMTEVTSDLQVVRVICKTASTDYTDLTVTGNGVEYLSGTGEYLACYWFNTKVLHATATVHKYACPEGYIPQGHTYEAVLEKCPAPQKGVTFTLGGPATELSRDTDAAGNVTWEALAPGPLFISETPPDGYTDAVVYCAIQPGGAGFEQVSVEQLAIEREVAAGESLECYWFDYSRPAASPSPTATPKPATGNPVVQPGTPTPAPDAPASLIITRHTCAAGYDLHDPDADPARDCAQAVPGVEFTMSALGDEPTPVPAEIVSSTDDDGVVTFDALDPGMWLLTETLPENGLTTFISTCDSDRRDFQQDNPFTPFAYAGPEGEIGVALLPGETLECDSYAIPAGGVTLLAYQCPDDQANLAACEPAAEIIALEFVPLDDGAPITLMSDAIPAQMPAGIYSMADPPDAACLIDSAAFDPDGNLVVPQDEAIEIRLYTCAAAN